MSGKRKEAFTPGQWTVIVEKPKRGHIPLGAPTILVSAGGDMAIDCNRSGDTPKQSIANAHLIAAAPDLYAALLRVVMNPEARIGGDIRAEAIAALARARGEA